MEKEKELIDKEIEENPEEESILKKAIKKIFLILVSLFLLVLVLSYLLPSYNLFSIISSQFNSYKINENEIILKNNNKIIFENNAYSDLLKIYNENQQHEFKVCLIGDKEDNIYKIKKIEIPKIISQDFSSVRAEPCSKEAIISLHSHPYKSCYFSIHDTKTLKYIKNNNKDAFIGIMCEPDRFNFYGFE